MYKSILAMAFLLATSSFARAQDEIKIGYLGTFSGVFGAIGQDQYNGFQLALSHIGGKVGGMPTEIFKADDQSNPQVGLQRVKEMIERDHVDMITGLLFAGTIEAVKKPAFDSQTFLIGANAGPDDLAGAGCSPYFFSVSFQNGALDESMGRYLQMTGLKSVYLISVNYLAGRQSLAAFKRTYHGQILGEVYTSVDQQDYSSELASMKASGTTATYAFLPGGAINFLKQFHQFGLQSQIKLYSKSFVDYTALPAEGEDAIGASDFMTWNDDLDNPANRRFVADFKAAYHYTPSQYAMASYDSVQLIDSAVRITKGNLRDKNAFRAALHAARFESPRGPFKFNNNQFPIEDFHLVRAAKGADGKMIIVSDPKVVFNNVEDSLAKECPMH